MIKKTITYTDFNEETRTEPHYFHLSRAELVEMDATTVGGYKAMVEKAAQDGDTPTLFKIVKNFVVSSYGKKSLDGKTFKKSPEITEEFIQSEAYSELLIELLSDAQVASDFINGIVNSVTSTKGETSVIASGN